MRAMVELSRRFGDGPVSLTEIAETSSVPPAYLEQIVGPLREAELVKSTRGAHGGYQLTRHPSELVVGEVYRALEGPVAPMSCVSEATDAICPLIDGCATRFIWLKVRDSIVDALDSMTLADLLRANGETVVEPPASSRLTAPLAASAT